MSDRSRHWHVHGTARVFLAAAALAGVTLAGSSASAQTSTLWSSAGGDRFNTRNASGEVKISPANVGSLAEKWAYPTAGDISATPAVEKVKGKTVVYAVDWGVRGDAYAQPYPVPDGGGYLHAIDADTGAAKWSKKVSDYTGFAPSVSRTSPAIAGNNLIIGDRGNVNSSGFPGDPGLWVGAPITTAGVMAVNKNTGAPVWRTVVSTHPFSVITSSPIVHGNVVYVGVASMEENAGFIPGYIFSFRGKVVALDVNSGAILWETSMIDQGSYNVGYTGIAIWSSTPVADGDRGSLYVTTGNNYTSPDGVGNPVTGPDTPPGNLVDSVVALDLKTGAIKWTFRAREADTWDVARQFGVTRGIDPATLGPDHDFASGAMLFLDKNGRQLLGAGDKSGLFYALDPSTGAEVWRQKVGVDGLAGGIQWGPAVDGNRVYVAISNADSKDNNYGTYGGHWTALDPSVNGNNLLWTTVDPTFDYEPGKFPRWGKAFGQVTVANGVVFAGSAGGGPIPASFLPPGLGPVRGFPGAFYAMDAATGQILWSLPSDGAVLGGAAVVDGTVYWGGGGYSNLDGFFGITGNPKLFAFALPKK